MNAHERLWTAWISDFIDRRAPGSALGWYNLEEMRAAFDAGAEATLKRGYLELNDKLMGVLGEFRPPKPTT